jgi:hypothetical protein
MSHRVGRRGDMRALIPRACLLAGALLVVPVQAQTVSRNVEGFTKIRLQGPLDVTVRPGKTFSLLLDMHNSEDAAKIST